MTISNLVIMLAAFCAVIALFNGIVSMAHGGDEDQNQSHKLMFRRVGWQAFAFLAILFAMLSNLK